LKSIEDIKSFRLACKQTAQALASEVLHHITVNITTETSARELSKLQYFASEAEGSSIVRLAIQQLDIKSLFLSLNLGGETDAEEDDAMANRRLLETLSYEAELQKCLYKALSSLTAVRTVKYVYTFFLNTFVSFLIDRWKPASADKKWAHLAVMDALTTLPNLQSLSVEWGYQIEIPFHLFTTLRHVSVKCEDNDKGTTFENLTKMISQSPLLESVDFMNDRSGYSGTDGPRSLHRLFERYPEDIPPLRLKHLSLADCLVRLDDETVMRHLRYLTSLSLENLLHPFPSGDPCSANSDISVNYDAHYGDPISANVLETLKRWGSTYEQIWRTIYNADLRLEEITVQDFPSAFLEYMGSYSGLKKLVISTGGFKDGLTSDNCAKKFYETLEMHAGSMEELQVLADYDGVWCFGHHNKDLFPTFHNLKTLDVKVQSSDLVPDSEVEQSSRQDIIVRSGPFTQIESRLTGCTLRTS
jgi:hypothetical protein